VANGPPSTLHSNRASGALPASVDENANDALVSVVELSGWLVICAVGGTESMTQVLEAGVGSWLPAASKAHTCSVCCPSARPEYEMLGPHAAAAAPSSEHVYLPLVPAPEAMKLAVGWLMRLVGPPLSAVSGGTVSTVQVAVATEDTFPAKSVTLTEYVC
jgi:hypothetical protein